MYGGEETRQDKVECSSTASTGGMDDVGRTLLPMNGPFTYRR